MRKTKRLLCVLSALVMAAGLTACGKTAAGPETVPPAPAQSTEAALSAPAESGAAERTRTETVLLDGQETTAYLDVTDEDIQFWDSPSGGTLLAAARYPKALPGAADALESCKVTDLDGDGNSDLSASERTARSSCGSMLTAGLPITRNFRGCRGRRRPPADGPQSVSECWECRAAQTAIGRRPGQGRERSCGALPSAWTVGKRRRGGKEIMETRKERPLLLIAEFPREKPSVGL